MENNEDKHELHIKKLNSLINFLRQTQYAPDIEAMIVIASWYISHWFLSEKPVWIMVLGPSGMGKSSLAIDPVSALERVHSCSIIGDASFLSGFGDDNGILQQFTKNYNGNGMICFNDFSSVLEMDPRERAKVLKQLREIYDGGLSKDTGNKGKIEWMGKCSAIAACTNKIERYSSVFRDLGERWVYLRWRYGLRDKYMDYAHEHRENEIRIRDRLREIFNGFIDRSTVANLIPKANREEEYDKIKKLQSLARFACKSRVVIEREWGGKNITYTGEEEGPNRVYKCIMNTAIASACLMRQTRITNFNLNIGKRLAIDTIPLERRQILSLLAKAHPSPWPIDALGETLGLTRWTCKKRIEDLSKLKLIKSNEDEIDLDNLDKKSNNSVALNTEVVTTDIIQALLDMPLRILTNEETKGDAYKLFITEDD